MKKSVTILTIKESLPLNLRDIKTVATIIEKTV